jgi:hypothetical protein
MRAYSAALLVWSGILLQKVVHIQHDLGEALIHNCRIPVMNAMKDFQSYNIRMHPLVSAHYPDLPLYAASYITSRRTGPYSVP